MRDFLLLVVAFCTMPPIYAQESDVHGTVIVTGHSKTKLIVAADSRNVGKTTEVCKILVLNNRTIFAVSGDATHANPQVTYWNAYAQAWYTFENAKSSPNTTRLKNAADSFGARFTNEVNQALKTDTKGSTELIQENGNTVVNAVFSGFENNLAEMYRVSVNYDPSSRIVNYKLDTVANSDEIAFGASGWNETVLEVLTGATPFSKSERRKWRMFSQGIPLRDRDLYLAMRLVELTMMYHPHREDVGGSIDALEITTAGIRWVQCKPKCQCDSKPLALPPEARKRLESE